MNVNGQLQQFFTTVAGDERISSAHICLYMGLIHHWIESKGQNPISISRRGLMKTCKFNGLATYHKYMKELHDFGYIKYIPSYHPIIGSLVYFI